MKRICFLLLVSTFLRIEPVQAQFSVLFIFNVYDTIGGYPAGSPVISGNKIYGVASGKHDSGCIFTIDTNGNNYKEFFTFHGANGYEPFSTLTLSGNKLFGVTYKGGAYDSGCIFSVDTNGNEYKKLFDFSRLNGTLPECKLVLCGKMLYGMTRFGGTNSYGCIFSIDTAGNTYKKLFDFGGANGEYPTSCSLIYSAGILYGMTTSGGSLGQGNIFCIDTNGTGFRDLFDFNGSNGAGPRGDLTLISNKLYGMTWGGGALGDGNIFSIDTTGNNFRDLFDFNGTNGNFAMGSLIFLSKTLYGMTNKGGARAQGNIFSIDTNGSNFTDMLNFNDTNGSWPTSSLSLYGNTLFGMANGGGITGGIGEIFKIDNGNAVTEVNELRQGSGSVALFPNPNNGVFTLQMRAEKESGEKVIEIYNMVGELVKSEELRDKNTNINLGNSADGVYLYRILSKTNNLVGEGKFVIQ